MTWVEPRFRMARRGGYDVLEVDELIDELEAAARGLSGRAFTAQQVRSAQFRVSRRAGYLEADVDAWLDQVARDLDAGSVPDPAGPVPDPAGPPRWIVLTAVAALLVGLVLALYALL